MLKMRMEHEEIYVSSSPYFHSYANVSHSAASSSNNTVTIEHDENHVSSYPDVHSYANMSHSAASSSNNTVTMERDENHVSSFPDVHSYSNMSCESCSNNTVCKFLKYMYLFWFEMKFVRLKHVIYCICISEFIYCLSFYTNVAVIDSYAD